MRASSLCGKILLDVRSMTSVVELPVFHPKSSLQCQHPSTQNSLCFHFHYWGARCCLVSVSWALFVEVWQWLLFIPAVCAAYSSKELDCFANASALLSQTSSKQEQTWCTSQWKHYGSGTSEANLEKDDLMEMPFFFFPNLQELVCKEQKPEILFLINTTNSWEVLAFRKLQCLDL